MWGWGVKTDPLNRCQVVSFSSWLIVKCLLAWILFTERERETETERQRERDRERETEIETEGDRQTERQWQRQTDRQRHRQTDRDRETDGERARERVKDWFLTHSHLHRSHRRDRERKGQGLGNGCKHCWMRCDPAPSLSREVVKISLGIVFNLQTPFCWWHFDVCV